jgi:phosphodiesterase/alkaline phosphatase D-like protein
MRTKKKNLLYPTSTVCALGVLLCCCMASAVPASGAGATGGPYQATGFKVAEVTSDSAIVWTRTTLRPRPNPGDAPMATFVYDTGEDCTTNARTRAKRLKGRIVVVTCPEGMSAADIRYAAPGVSGETRVLYRPADGGTSEWQETKWGAVDSTADFIRQIKLTGLKSNTLYRLRVETHSPCGSAGQTLEGGFLTAADPDTPAKFVFAVSTGADFRGSGLPGRL